MLFSIKKSSVMVIYKIKVIKNQKILKIFLLALALKFRDIFAFWEYSYSSKLLLRENSF